MFCCWQAEIVNSSSSSSFISDTEFLTFILIILLFNGVITLNILLSLSHVVMSWLLTLLQFGDVFMLHAITRSHGVAEPVRVQLIKSFCLPLLYCIGALSLKRSAVHMLSVCWIDAFRCIFNDKRSESVRILQVGFGTLDFRHLYDLHRWRFLQTIGCKSTYWAPLFDALNVPVCALVTCRH